MTTDGAALLRDAVKAFEDRERGRAAALLRRLNDAAPPLGAQWKAASRLAATLGESTLSVAMIRHYVADDPRDKARRLDYGAVLAEAGQVERALDVTRNFLPHVGNDPQLLFLAGTCAAQIGDRELATEAFRIALDSRPFPALAAAIWLALGDLKTFTADDPDLAAMQALRAAQTPAPSALLYALGKAHDDFGDTGTAWALWSEGAAQRRAAEPPATSDAVDQIPRRATVQFFRGLAPSGVVSARPIFVLGLPRSGTTLVEQLLASHSAVAGGAELNLFRAAAMAVPGMTPDEIAGAQLRRGPGLWGQIGQAYLHMLEDRFGPDGRVVDKTLNHGRMLGLIHHVLPNARFIWMRRDPGDTALSCFRSHFADGLAWSWSLPDIAERFREDDRLHDGWTTRYPEAILTVPYEGLVADPKLWVQRLFEHVGLDYEPAALDFHKTQRAVTTTSASQVRQPLYTRAVGGWRRYAEPMRAFFDAYGETPASA